MHAGNQGQIKNLGAEILGSEEKGNPLYSQTNEASLIGQKIKSENLMTKLTQSALKDFDNQNKASNENQSYLTRYLASCLPDVEVLSQLKQNYNNCNLSQGSGSLNQSNSSLAPIDTKESHSGDQLLDNNLKEQATKNKKFIPLFKGKKKEPD